MGLDSDQTLLLVGVNPTLAQVLGAYIGNKFRIIAINREFTLEELDSYTNLQLIIIDTDQFHVKIPELMKMIRSDSKYRDIPTLGLALRNHFAKMPQDLRIQFEDIILIPCSNEDLLTRIDVWILTFRTVRSNIDTKSFALDSLHVD